MENSTTRRRLAFAIILALAVIPYFIGLGASSLWDSNEAFYAETPREMIERGDYVNPTFNYQPRFNKPPLCYWVVAGCYKLLGISEQAERLPIAAGAVVLMLTALLLARAFFSLEAGLIAAIAMAANPRFFMFARRIIIDLYTAMFMGLALLFFALAETRPQRRRLYLALMYASIGFGVLTKGPVAIVLPALAFFIYLLATKRLSRIREMMIPAGIIIVAAIVLPWYAAIYAQHGWHYIESFILRDNISRYTEPVWGPSRGYLFYLPVIMGDFFPWSIFLPVAFGLAIRSLFIKGSRQAIVENRSEGGLLLLIWVAVIVVFFSLSRSKEDLYILPAYVAAAAMVGALLARFIQGNDEAADKRARLLLRWAAAIAGAIVALAGAMVVYLFGRAARAYDLAGAEALGYVALCGGAAVALLALARRRAASVASLALTVIALNWIFAIRTLPDFERYKPARSLSAVIRANASRDASVGYYRLASPSMVFYLRRPIFEYYKPEEVIEAFASNNEVFCLMMERDYLEVRENLPAHVYVLASNPVFQVKLKGIFDRAELPQAVLITNKSGAGITQ